jgi:multicomponent K+:H+ antiporter subunit G
MSWTAAVLILLGAVLAFGGSLGLVRLKTFYERVHPPTMGTTLGTGLVLLGSMLHFSALESRPVVHEVLIGVFMTLTTPVTYMLLVRAALHRDRAKNRDPLQTARFRPPSPSGDRT